MGERGRRFAAACLLIAVSACTRVSTAPATNGLHAWTQPDRLRLASTEEPDSLNKLFANSDASDQVANLISAPVFRYDDKGDYVPEMAADGAAAARERRHQPRQQDDPCFTCATGCVGKTARRSMRATCVSLGRR